VQCSMGPCVDSEKFGVWCSAVWGNATQGVAACCSTHIIERWGAGVETQKNVRGEIGGWGGVPFNEPYVPSLSTIYDGA